MKNNQRFSKNTDVSLEIAEHLQWEYVNHSKLWAHYVKLRQEKFLRKKQGLYQIF